MAENVPSENEIRKKMEKLVPTVNLETVTTKQFIKLLSKKMGDVKLSSKKKFIKKTLTEIIDAMEAAKSDESAPSSSSSEEEEVKSKKRVTRKKASASSSRGGKGGGLTAVKEVSDELAAFLGKGKQMARTEVVKCLWEYIKENDLQNPNDRREILLDERLKEVFHADKFTMFSMNKYVSAHVYPFTPVNLTELSEKSKKRKELQKEKAAKRQKTGKKRKSGTQAPWRLSADLASVVGKAILPRPQITQGLWAYIREHGLQVSNQLQFHSLFHSWYLFSWVNYIQKCNILDILFIIFFPDISILL